MLGLKKVSCRLIIFIIIFFSFLFGQYLGTILAFSGFLPTLVYFGCGQVDLVGVDGTIMGNYMHQSMFDCVEVKFMADIGLCQIFHHP